MYSVGGHMVSEPGLEAGQLSSQAWSLRVKMKAWVVGGGVSVDFPAQQTFLSPLVAPGPWGTSPAHSQPRCSGA